MKNPTAALGLTADIAAVGLLLWLTLVYAGFLPASRFAAERIEVTVRPRAIEVDALYIFKNPLPFPMVQGLSYPFPVDASHPKPDSITVCDVDASGRDAGEKGYYWLSGLPRFSVRVPARGEARLRVRYTQDAAVDEASYILTTTKPWGRPLEHGDYVLIPKGVRVAQSNYALDGPDRLSFSRDRFMPERDWRFSWKRL